MRSIQYRPEIDGLRTLAVLPVILFHMGLSQIPGGFVGVDVFFVISGYLITSIIAKEQQQGKFTFKVFWTRRAKRILPVLLTVIFATLLANYFIGYRNAYTSQGPQALSAIFSVSNLYMWKMAGDYWGPKAETLPFLHCWSLSVEEQFYLAYPFLLIWLLRVKKQLVVPAIAALVVVSLGLFLYFSSRSPSAVFYLLPCRMWELGAGCLLALLNERLATQSTRWYSVILSTTGLVLICASYVLFPSESSGFKLIFPVLGATLFVGFAHASKGVGKLLSLPAVVYVGTISYSLYIWHWPVIVLARQRDPEILSSGVGMSFLLALIFALSVFSYHFVESPLRRSPQTLKLLPLGLAACLGAIAIPKLLISSRGDAYDTSAFSRVAYPLLKYNVRPEVTLSPTEQKKLYGVDVGVRPEGADHAYAQDGIVHRYGSASPAVLMLGDSHGIMWADVVDEICRERGLTVSYFLTVGASPFVYLPLGAELSRAPGFTPQQKRQFDVRRLACIKKWKPLVIISALWAASNREQVRDLIEYIGRNGCKIVLVEQPPEVELGDQNSAQYLAYRRYVPMAKGQRQTFPQSSVEDVAKGRELLRELTREYPFCQLLETYDYYAADSKNAYVLDGKDILYLDDDHLSSKGASFIRSRFARAISTNLGNSSHPKQDPVH